MTGGRVLMLLGNCGYPADGRVRRESRALVAAGYRVTVLCPREAGDARRETVQGVDVVRYRVPIQGGHALTFFLEHVWVALACLVWSVRLARRPGFDVVHAANPPDTLGLVGSLWKLAGVRFVYDHHDLTADMYRARSSRGGSRAVFAVLRAIERFDARHADVVIAPNESYASIEQSWGVEASRLHVVRNGPEPDILEPARPNLAIRGGAALVLCYAGVIGPQDGIDYLVRAVAHLVHTLGWRDMRCVVVGHGDAVAGAEELAADLGVGAQMRFVGRVPPTEVGAYVKASDICVEPAPKNPYNDRSTMIKVMEYMALSKPVVAFDLHETRVTAGASGCLVRPNDPRALAEAIAALGRDRVLQRRMGLAGRERVERRLLWAHAVPALLAAYERVSA